MAAIARSPFPISLKPETVSHIFFLANDPSLSQVNRGFQKANSEVVERRRSADLLNRVSLLILGERQRLEIMFTEPMFLSLCYRLLRQKVLAFPMQFFSQPQIHRLSPEHRRRFEISQQPDRNAAIQRVEADYAENFFPRIRFLRLLQILVPLVPEALRYIPTHLQWVRSETIQEMETYIGCASHS